MSGQILRIYAMAVCFFSLMCGSIALGIGLFNIVKLAAPSATINPVSMQHLQSPEVFRQSPQVAARLRSPAFFVPGQPFPGPRDPVGEMEELSDEELEAMRVRQLEQAYDSHRFRARQGLIQQSIIVFISVVLFLLHWRLARTKPEDEEKSS